MSKAASLAVLVTAAVISFIAGFFIAAPLRGGLIAALQPILITPTAAAALIVAAFSMFASLLSLVVTYRMGSKQIETAKIVADAAMMNAKHAGTRALANVRLEWLNDLRDTLSKYHSILMSPEDGASESDDKAKGKAKEKADQDTRDLSYLGTKLDLLLNQRKKYQQALWQVSDDILKIENPTEDEYDKADKQLVAAARNVFDFHWRKIKAEILGNDELKEPIADPSKHPAQGQDA
jgi:hypothetical protein